MNLAQRHRDALALAVLVALAIVPRAGLLLRAPIFITNDSLSYVLPGFDLATGLGFEPIFKRPPAYPAFIAAVFWFFGQQSLTGLLLAQHAIGVLTVGLAYLLGRQLFGRAAGWVAGLLTALSGPLIVTEHYLMSETLFGLLLTAALLAAVGALHQRRLGLLASAGLLLGLAALTRPVAQVLLPAIWLLCFWSWREWRRAAFAAVVVTACYAVVVLPWMARNGVVQRSFTVAGGLGEGLAVRTIRLGQEFDFRPPAGASDPLREERRIYREEARQGSVYELAARLREEAELSPAEADRAMRDIALGAIAQRPWYYIGGSLDMFVRMFAGRTVRLRQDWEPWRGIAWEARVEHLLPAATTEQEQQFDQAQALVTLYDPARWPWLVGLLFALGCLAAARRADRGPALLPAFAALVLLLASAFLVGIEWRYRYPLDPAINVLVGGGVLTVWEAIRLAGRGGRGPGGWSGRRPSSPAGTRSSAAAR